MTFRVLVKRSVHTYVRGDRDGQLDRWELCSSSEGRLIARNWIPPFVVHFFHLFSWETVHRIRYSLVLSDPLAPSTTTLRGLEPLLYVITRL